MASSINASTSGAGGVITTADNTGILNLQTASTTAVTVDASQNVGIGTTSPSKKLHVYRNDTGQDAQIQIEQAGSGSPTLGFLETGVYAWLIGQYGADNSFRIAASGADLNTSPRLTIDTSGRVIIGSTTSTDTTRLGVVSSTSGVNTNTSAITSTSGTRYHWTFQDGSSSTERGSITTNGSATAYNTSSDYRLKENIAPMTGALATVQALKPVTYTWKESGDNGQGFIAHELQAVVPDCVTGEKDAVETYSDEDGNEQTRPKYQSVDTSFLVATLTAAIQEQQTIINDLKARVTALEAK